MSTVARAFTLLEVLAAVTLLGLLALAATPLVVRLGRGELSLVDRWEAQRLLRSLNAHLQADGEGVQPIPDHPGWWLRRVAVTPGPPPVSAPGAPPPTTQPHRWWRLAVYAGPGAGDALLADAMLLDVSSAGRRP